MVVMMSHCEDSNSIQTPLPLELVFLSRHINCEHFQMHKEVSDTHSLKQTVQKLAIFI